jgi:phosphoribosylamine--glycine ligase
MRVLVVGSGGREHAIIWKFKQSPSLKEIYSWPGNCGTLSLAKPLDLSPSATFEQLAQACKKQAIDFVFVGPEGPLEQGIVDALQREGVKVFGPNKEGAQLESSKEFSKKLMIEAGIPTAAYSIARSKYECLELAERILTRDGSVVLKASGLAAGKGVFVCASEMDVQNAIERLYSPSLAESAKVVVVEEMLYGRECSYFCFLGEGPLERLGFAVDHKRLKAGDKGPNTGGMGCYTPVSWLSADAADQVEARVVVPLMEALKRHSIKYTGCLYVGIMWGDNGPAVVEFNVRLGDPEAQVLALSDPADWLPAVAAKVGITIEKRSSSVQTKKVMGYVLASNCYPYGEIKNSSSEIPHSAISSRPSDDVQVFQAAVEPSAKGIKSGKGRVLLVAGAGASFFEAKTHALARIDEIRKYWPDFQWRPDIGLDVLQLEESKVSTDKKIPIILGSSSPRRQELLKNLGLKFDVLKPDTEEKQKKGEAPLAYVQRNAYEKNIWICNKVRSNLNKEAIVICADTIVVLDERVFEKPRDASDAKKMLTELSGKRHKVYTSVCIAKMTQGSKQDELREFVVCTEVTIKSLTTEEMDGYIATKEPFDKAGGYAAQGMGSFMVKDIRGSFSNVVGLPLAELSDILSQDFNVPLWRDHRLSSY